MMPETQTAPTRTRLVAGVIEEADDDQIIIDDGGVPEEEDGWGHKGCDWDESPCGEMKEYFISYRCTVPDHADHATHTEQFCPRHYALTLHYILEVRVPLNKSTFDAEIFSHGPLAGS
ncbi:hypothetical protein [Corynebacterium aquatimens]|uniref:Uncharacterized protein n=1 Tax=Corynebacterium aquatimens TaxID=1190508 RepID=A0A931DW75_9CORY|nr:hypothetical protein [Corynebacterium aquatimens]MBG6121235.1 hypothetical protein [Corynebacterium aquatimens]WJY66213.1 hypothetical protein CAQUA_07585 [Corynebacterium aquatimens]